MKNVSRYAAWHLLNLYMKDLFAMRAEVMGVIYFLALIFTIFHFAHVTHTFEALSMSGIVVITLLLSLILFIDRLFVQDRKEGFLELVYLSGLSISAFLLIKFIILILISVVLVLMTLMLAALMFDMNYDLLIELLISIMIMLPAIVGVMLFIAIITFTYPTKIVHYILSLPLMIPLVIMCIGSLENVHYRTLCIGLDFIYLPVFGVLSVQLLKAMPKV